MTGKLEHPNVVPVHESSGRALRASRPGGPSRRNSVRVETNRVKVHLDTRGRPGWNEIDAVELVGPDGSRQWGVRASASSFFAR